MYTYSTIVSVYSVCYRMHEEAVFIIFPAEHASSMCLAIIGPCSSYRELRIERERGKFDEGRITLWQTLLVARPFFPPCSRFTAFYHTKKPALGHRPKKTIWAKFISRLEMRMLITIIHATSQNSHPQKHLFRTLRTTHTR